MSGTEASAYSLTSAEAARLRVLFWVQGAFVLGSAAAAVVAVWLLAHLFAVESTRLIVSAIKLVKIITPLDDMFGAGTAAGLVEKLPLPFAGLAGVALAWSKRGLVRRVADR